MGPSRPMRLRHVNSSVGTTAVKVPVRRGIGQYIRIKNTHGANDLFFSFNHGRDYATLAPGVTFEVNALFHWIVLLGEAADTTYELLIGEG